jgi:hypothetical protein
MHEICFHGNGGYDFNTVYNMPIWLRKFTFNEIKVFKEKEVEAYNKSSNSNSNTTSINMPQFNKPMSGKGSYGKK